MLLFICTIVPADMFIYKFQYISCYCLSDSVKHTFFAKKNFNTSHVTVYQKCLQVFAVSFHISIHLMLLFIPSGWKTVKYDNVFQYISCYCLSLSISGYVPLGLISIHLMLLFIVSTLL